VYTYLELPGSDETVEITYAIVSRGLTKMRCLDPDTGRWQEASLNIQGGNRISIPRSMFGRSREGILVLQ
jgi:hypothetical protein